MQIFFYGFSAPHGDAQIINIDVASLAPSSKTPFSLALATGDWCGNWHVVLFGGHLHVRAIPVENLHARSTRRFNFISWYIVISRRNHSRIDERREIGKGTQKQIVCSSDMFKTRISNSTTNISDSVLNIITRFCRSKIKTYPCDLSSSLSGLI